MEWPWVAGVFRQCRAANVPFFFKQWRGVQKHRTGRKIFGRIYDEMPVLDSPEPSSRSLVVLNA